MASFGYTIHEVVRFHTYFALIWNYASASMRIHLDFQEAAYKVVAVMVPKP